MTQSQVSIAAPINSIDVVIQHLTLDELQQLSVAFVGRGANTVKLGPLQGSAWVSIAAAIVNTCVRRSKIGQVAERTLWTAQCSKLKERIDKRLAALAPQGQTAVADSTGSVTADRGMSDGEYIQTIFEVVLGRCAHPRDIQQWVARLRSNELDRQAVLSSLFYLAIDEAKVLAKGAGTACSVMGTQRTLDSENWKSRAAELEGQGEPTRIEPYGSFSIKAKPQILVTAIASLYRGGEYIEQFLQNIIAQTVFEEHCELVIVDANSPDDEASVIERYLSGRKNIQYFRMNCRVGIYQAWNLAIKLARGSYITSTNVDDLRRSDSFELQAAVLENLDFVDIVYQDFYYTLDPKLDAAEVARFGYRSDLPLVTPYSMISCNSPHNAPMWRKSLHDELGLFDARYQSAGDYEFWLRCVSAGKTFYKLNDPHVIYYHNPRGLSTRPETRGVDEVRDVLKHHSRALISPNVTSDLQDFMVDTVGLPEPLHSDCVDDFDQRYAIVQRELRKLGLLYKF